MIMQAMTQGLSYETGSTGNDNMSAHTETISLAGSPECTTLIAPIETLP